MNKIDWANACFVNMIEEKLINKLDDLFTSQVCGEVATRLGNPLSRRLRIRLYYRLYRSI